MFVPFFVVISMVLFDPSDIPTDHVSIAGIKWQNHPAWWIIMQMFDGPFWNKYILVTSLYNVSVYIPVHRSDLEAVYKQFGHSLEVCVFPPLATSEAILSDSHMSTGFHKA